MSSEGSPAAPAPAAPSEAFVSARSRPSSSWDLKLTCVLLYFGLVLGVDVCSRLRSDARKAKIQARGEKGLAKLANTARGAEGAKMYENAGEF